MAFAFFFFILNYNYINLNNLIGQIEREPPGTPEKQKLARLQRNIDENNPKQQINSWGKERLDCPELHGGGVSKPTTRSAIVYRQCVVTSEASLQLINHWNRKELTPETQPPYTGRSFTVSRVRATTCSSSSSPLKRSTALKMDIHANRHPMNRSTASRNLSLPRSKTLGSQCLTCSFRLRLHSPLMESSFLSAEEPPERTKFPYWSVTPKSETKQQRRKKRNTSKWPPTGSKSIIKFCCRGKRVWGRLTVQWSTPKTGVAPP